MKEQNTQSLTERVINGLIERRERVLSGKINCIPWGLPRFEESNPGIEQGKYYNFTANSKVGKTQITDALFVYNPIKQVIFNNLNVKIKIFYFSLEMTKEEKMLACISNTLYTQLGIRVAPKDLRSTRKDNVLSKDNLDKIYEYEEYFKQVEEIVTFIDDVRTGYGMYATVRNYMEENGTTHYVDYQTTEEDSRGNTKTVTKKRRDYYEPNNPDEYVIMIIDHIGLITPESRGGVKMDLRESIGVLSSDYLIKLRNFYVVIPVVVQQQASSQESVENKKANRLKPTLDGLGDNKTTQRDADFIMGLFSPFRHELRDYQGYDVGIFKDNIRFLEILGGREGGAGDICPLYFDGATNVFHELPLPNDENGIQSVYRKLDKIRKL